MTNESGTIDVTQVKNLDVTANPAALGLTAFGITTVLLNLGNAGDFGLGSMILAMGIFYGGLGQIIAGIMERKKNNTFGMTAFLSFGIFWLTLVTLLILPKPGSRTRPVRAGWRHTLRCGDCLRSSCSSARSKQPAHCKLSLAYLPCCLPAGNW